MKKIGSTILGLCMTLALMPNVTFAKTAADMPQGTIDLELLKPYTVYSDKINEPIDPEYNDHPEYMIKNAPDSFKTKARPKELPMIAYGIIHIADNGKQDAVPGYFSPSTSGYARGHLLNELAREGVYRSSNIYEYFYPDNEQDSNIAIWPFTDSKYEVVAYDDNWVAVWDTGWWSREVAPLSGVCGSWFYKGYAHPGVYYIPRENVYLILRDNHLDTKYKNIKAAGTSTALLAIKASPERENYIKSGVYKVNDSFEILDPEPVNGHYKVFYMGGAYYVNADYVNLKRTNVRKPVITYTATADQQTYDYINVRAEAASESESLGKIRTGTKIEMIEKDYNKEYAKIWYNSRECYVIKTALKNLKANVTELSPPSAGKSKSYTVTANTQAITVDREKYEVLAYNIKGNNYFKIRDIAKMLSGTVKTVDVEWDENKNAVNLVGMFRYTDVGGELTPGDGAQRTAVFSQAALLYDGLPVKAVCYNVDGNNYFKLRDVTDALDCRVEWDEKTSAITITPTLPAKEDPNEIKG